MNIRTNVMDILAAGHLMSLATVDDVGVWVADVIYIFDDELNIYWMSHPDTRHSRALTLHNQVAGTITISSRSKENNLGIQFAGMAEKLDGPRFDLATKHLNKRNHPSPKEEDDVLGENSWYVLSPTNIDLIDESQFGFVKQSFEL